MVKKIAVLKVCSLIVITRKTQYFIRQLVVDNIIHMKFNHFCCQNDWNIT